MNTTSTDNHITASQIKLTGLLGGILLFICMILLPTPQGFSDTGWAVAALAVLMAVYWMTEAIPLAATALFPIVILPLLNIKPLDQIASSYTHPLIFLFLGGFMIAKALEHWDLHRRIALGVLRISADSPASLIGWFMVATAFLSMWISNTATAMVMMPIASAIIHSLLHKTDSEKETGKFATVLMLGVAFSATIGGMATLIGTPPNALLAGYLQTVHNKTVGFGQWMLLGVPVSIVLLSLTWFLLTQVIFRFSGNARLPMSNLIEETVKSAKPFSPGAKMTAIIIGLTGLALLLRPFMEKMLPLPPLGDAGIVMLAVLILFSTPSGQSEGEKLLRWEDAKSIRWDVLILFGGGLALASAIESSGLSQAIGGILSYLNFLPIALVLFLTMITIVFLGELASNTAMAAVFLPVAGAAAIGLGVPPLDIALPVGLAASLGFMLPVATPPNAIVYGSGFVASEDMMRAGIVLDIITIPVVYLIYLAIGQFVF